MKRNFAQTSSPEAMKGGAKLFVLSAMLVGMLLGVVSLGFTLKQVVESTSIHNAAWIHNPYVGSDKASGYTRALVSIIGFLGMAREESIYFMARTDDEDKLLSGSCTYKVSAYFSPEQARWWSITAYNALSSKLIANEHKRYSFNGDNVQRNEDGSFTLWVSPEPQPGNWIPVQAGKPFDLTLRLYNPSDAVRNDVQALALPSVGKVGC